MPRPRRPQPARSLADLPPGTRAIGYLRHSPGQDQRIDSQVAALDQYVAERQWRLVHPWWIDEFREGSTDKREQFQAFLEYARQDPRPAEVVLIWSFSRFARSLVLSQFYLADLRMRGYKVVSVTDDIPEGDFAIILESLTHWKNEQFLRDLSKDVKRGLRTIVTQQITLPDGTVITGFSGGGFPPRGYRAVRIQTGIKRNGEPRWNSYWELDPLWQERVTRAWEMKVVGRAILDIHEQTRLFRDLSSYYDMFRNRQYTGRRVNGDVEVSNAHPAYVDEATFEAIQAMLPKGDSRMDTRRTTSPFLLSGFATCGYCGARLNYHPDHRRQNAGQIKCPNRAFGRRVALRGGTPCELRSISRRKLETTVLAAVRDQILTPDHVAALVDSVNRQLDERAGQVEQERARLRAEGQELERRIEKLLDDLETAERGEESARIRQRLAERTRRQAELRRELQDLDEAERQQGQLRINPAAVVAVLADLRAALDEAEPEDRRAVIGAFVQHVNVWNDRAEILYTFPLERKVLVQSEVPPRGWPDYTSILSLTVPLIPGWPTPAPRACPVCGQALTPRQLRRGAEHCSRGCAQQDRRARMRQVARGLGLPRQAGRFKSWN